MTPTQGSNVCPLCLNVYLCALSHYLKQSHFIKNVKDRQILLNLATGRVNIHSAPCPVLGCQYNSSRLDKHLVDGHPELSHDDAAVQHMNVHDPKTRKRLPTFMCHNLETAKRFYSLMKNRTEAKVLRKQFEDVSASSSCKASTSAAGKAKLKDTSSDDSEDSTKIQYQESGSSALEEETEEEETEEEKSEDEETKEEENKEDDELECTPVKKRPRRMVVMLSSRQRAKAKRRLSRLRLTRRK